MVYRKNNSGFVLLLSVVLIIFLGLLLEAASLRANIELQESTNRLASQQAFYAAESALQSAVASLGQNPNYWENEGAMAGVQYSSLYINNSSQPLVTVGFNKVYITNAPNYESFQSVWVKAWGMDAQKKVTVAILAQVVVESPASFLISTAGNLQVTSGSTLNYNILGNNVNFNVNQSLSGPAEDITVNGNVYYLASVTDNDPSAVTITGGPPTQSPTQTFSGVDTNYYQNQAQNGGLNCATSSNSNCDGQGNLTINGDISKASLNAPNGVVYAPGNITITGTVQDSMVIVAGGNINIAGDVSVPSSSNGTLPQNNASAPQLGLLAAGDVIIPDSAPDDLTIDAFIMANGGPGSQGGILQAQGVKYSKGTINIMGSMSLRGTGATTAADLNVYTVRNYVYNTQFQNNLQIPFLPAISQIVTWQEVNPSDPLPSP